MKVRKNKKGFTIVEIVIVMAVIAVLAAVMIPTFSGIIEKANESHDTSLVANINTIVTMEQVVSGTPTDAIEIQRLIKSQGLSLETKSRGKYLWYDLETNTVVLAGLNEDGIALPAANARGPVSDKGKFKEVITSPWDFVKGYLFITEESKDGLADAICTLHNPEGADDLKEALKKIENYGNEKLTAALKSFYAKTAVMTEGGIVFAGDNSATVDRVIVSAEMETVTASAILDVKKYPNVLVVDFHSGVAKTEGDVSGAMNELSGVFFVYAGEELGALANDVPNLIPKNERNELIKRLTLVYIDTNKTTLKTVAGVAEFAGDKVPYNAFGLVYGDEGTLDLYDLVNYSLCMDGAVSVPIDSNGYTLTDAEKLLIAPDGTLTIYAIFKPVSNQFVVDGKGYGSGAMTYMLANGMVTSGTVTVVSTEAKLDASLIGKASADLTLPAGVELLLPFTDDHTKFTQTFERLSYSSNKDKYAAEELYDKATMTGKTNLTIAGNVNLTVEAGASVYVDAQRFYDTGTAVQGFITDECGVLVIKENCKITSYGDITVYGVIRGGGTIDARGGSVSEVMTVYDWFDDTGDGTGASEAVGKNAAPFNNWKVEHIRVNTTIYGTTAYKAIGGVLLGDGVPVDFSLTGAENTQPLFVTDDQSKIVRSVADNGNLKITILKGSASDTAKNMIISDVVESIDATIDFTKISLPLSHFDVCVASDAELTISNNIYKVLPGSNITVDEGGTLNVNTKVVICNSFDLVFKEKTGTVEHIAKDLLTRDLYSSFAIIEDGKKMQMKVQPQKKEWNRWKDSGKETTKTVSVPHTYPEQAGETALLVNGTLKFNTDGKTNAAFAGKITSENADAKIIVVKGTVGGCSVPEGFCASIWYDTYDPDLYGQAKLDETLTDLYGTYTYAIEVVDGAEKVHWSPNQQQ